MVSKECEMSSVPFLRRKEQVIVFIQTSKACCGRIAHCRCYVRVMVAKRCTIFKSRWSGRVSSLTLTTSDGGSLGHQPLIVC